MQNISSINHANFARLHELTNNYNKATLLDKLVFWWQISTYTLDDGQIWFTRCLNQIAHDSKISKRSVERYLRDFEAAGLIEKTNRLYKKKNLYIRITEKLLVILGTPALLNTPSLSEQPNPADISPVITKSEGLFLNHFGVTDSANLAVSIYKEKDNNELNNSTVSNGCIVDKFKTPEPIAKKFPTFAIESQIGERLSEPFKNYIKGTLHNLQTQHNVTFSNPNQIFAEMVFSVLNVNHQFVGLIDNHHRINAIAKIMRQNQWKTPKGFYNHWDIGHYFKDKRHCDEARQRQEKLAELKTSGASQHPSIDYFSESNALNQSTFTAQCDDIADEYVSYRQPVNSTHYTHQTELNALQTDYNRIQNEIVTEGKYLHAVKAIHAQLNTVNSQRAVELAAIKLAKLHEQADEVLTRINQFRKTA